jgi:hypothetical protein
MIPFLPVIAIMLSAFSITFWIYDKAMHEADPDDEEFTHNLFY